jgi:ribonuclease-3
VNFKSKLLEWSQKNRIRLDFKMLSESKDIQGSPQFRFVVMLEGVEGCEGSGFSKKESQQIAAKLTLQKLRKDPLFLDSVFAAKTSRTKMEEEPAALVPDTELPQDFIITHTDTAEGDEPLQVFTDEHLSARHHDDLTADKHDNSREAIIAAAEQSAYSNSVGN